MNCDASRRPRIAIPMPHGSDPEYAQRAIVQYERAITESGGEPVRIMLDQSASEIDRIIGDCDGVLLPGSKADVDPARFHAERSPKTANADPRREEADDLLLKDAYRYGKPVLGICYGLQSLNVYRAGSLIQHIPDSLSMELRAKINHEAGSKVPVAHSVEIDSESLLARILGSIGEISPAAQAQRESKLTLPVNSSHHQSADALGHGLRVTARCRDDGIIEAVEGNSEDHFVLAVQWHPERSIDQDEASPKIFRAFVQAARERRV